MKIIVNKLIFENVLNSTLNFLEKKDFTQITSHILLVAKESKLTIKATDYEIGINLEIKNVDIEEEGVATANGRKIFDIVKILNDTDTIIETQNDTLLIKQQKSKYRLPMFNPMEFPTFPTLENKREFEINPHDFIKALKRVTPVIDTNNPKYELNGALINLIDDKIDFVATDTRRLAIVELKKEEKQENIEIIVPKKAITEIQKLFFNELNIYLDENILIVKSSNFILFSKLINGKFPNYQRIIPKELKIELKLNKNDVIEKIKQVAIISKEIKISINKNEIIFENLRKENEEAKAIIEYNSNLEEEISIKTQSRYIIDFLLNTEEREFILGYNDFNLPFLLKSDNFITIIMPIITE